MLLTVITVLPHFIFAQKILKIQQLEPDELVDSCPILISCARSPKPERGASMSLLEMHHFPCNFPVYQSETSLASHIGAEDYFKMCCPAGVESGN